jgi:hypothetical protein
MMAFGSQTISFLDYVLYFIAGAFLANGVPHFVQGICGNGFQTPFAAPPGRGDSSALVNVLWGWLNFAAGAALLHYFSPVRIPAPTEPCITAAFGALAMALYLAWRFGKVRHRQAIKVNARKKGKRR